jgi:hypothetical protein
LYDSKLEGIGEVGASFEPALSKRLKNALIDMLGIPK